MLGSFPVPRLTQTFDQVTWATHAHLPVSHCCLQEVCHDNPFQMDPWYGPLVHR